MDLVMSQLNETIKMREEYIIDLATKEQKIEELDDLKAFLTTFERSLKTYVLNDPKYGGSWKNTDLGPKGMFAELNAKMQRLKTLVWNTPDREMRKEKIAETIRDSIMYLCFMSRLMEKMLGPIDEHKARAEVDAT